MSKTIDKKLAAVCGLFCPACTIYIGTTEEPARLEASAQRMNRPVEDLQCNGCPRKKMLLLQEPLHDVEMRC